MQVRAEKTAALSHSLGRLRAGMSEAKVRERGCVCERERERERVVGCSQR